VSAVARTELLRRLPVRWSFALCAQIARLTRPDKTRALADWLRPLNPPGTPAGELTRQALGYRAMIALGARTHATVFRRGAAWIRRELRPEGLEHLDRLRADGGGALLLGTHFGLFSWVSHALLQLGYPHWLPQRLRTTADVIMMLRRDRLIPRALPYPDLEREGLHLRRLHGMLRRGDWVRHTGDIPDAADGLSGAMLGRPVRLVRAPWALARLSGVPVVPVVVRVDRRLTPRLVVGEPIHVSGGPQGEQAAFHVFLRFLEDQVRRAPWNLHAYVWTPWLARGATLRRLGMPGVLRAAGQDPGPDWRRRSAGDQSADW
jgi:lauroyl/myristoyl acyltransferase